MYHEQAEAINLTQHVQYGHYGSKDLPLCCNVLIVKRVGITLPLSQVQNLQTNDNGSECKAMVVLYQGLQCHSKEEGNPRHYIPIMPQGRV